MASILDWNRQPVKLAELEQEGQATYYNIRDLERSRPMLVLVALFVVAVVAFGGWQGVRSLIGLAVSFTVIIGLSCRPSCETTARCWLPWSGPWRSCWRRRTCPRVSARPPRPWSAPPWHWA